MQYFEQRRNPLLSGTEFLNAPVKGNSSVLHPPLPERDSGDNASLFTNAIASAHWDEVWANIHN